MEWGISGPAGALEGWSIPVQEPVSRLQPLSNQCPYQEAGIHKASQGCCSHCEPGGFLEDPWPPSLRWGWLGAQLCPKLPHGIVCLRGGISLPCQGGTSSCRNLPARLSIPHHNRSMMHCHVSRGTLLNLLISCNRTGVKKHLFPPQSHQDTG